jgi:hypothetical protein
VVLASSVAFAEDGDEGTAAQFRPRPVSNGDPRFAVGVKVGTLGIGVQVGTALGSRINLRGGANFFNYKDSLTEDGVIYNGSLQWRSVEALDLFVVGGFRVTPGLLLYNDNNVSATAGVATSSSVTFNGTLHQQSRRSIRGTAAITFKSSRRHSASASEICCRAATGTGACRRTSALRSAARRSSASVDGVGVRDGTVCQPVATTPSISANVRRSG